MRKVFLDTWAWAAIAHKGDDHHNSVFPFYKSFIVNNGIPVTTDYIIAETINLLRSRIDSEQTAVFIDTILDAAKNGRIILERIDERRWLKAWELSKKYDDKPYISFFDLSSFVVMKELRIMDVLTNDKHFEDIGMGFRKLF